MFLLLGFGVSSSSPHFPGYPTSICDEGVKVEMKHYTKKKSAKKSIILLMAVQIGD